MVVGMGDAELERRKKLTGSADLQNAVSSPLIGLTARDLEADAVRRAILDAGLQRSDIDGAVKVLAGPRSGVGVAELVGEQIDAYPRMLGLPVNVYYRVGRGGSWGTFGLITALTFLELGVAKYVAIAGSRADWTIEQTSESASDDERALSSIPAPPNWGPVFGRNSALHDFAELATARMAGSSMKREDLAEVVAQSRAWAKRNPLARHQESISKDEYLEASELVSPYSRYDLSAVTDGAVAIIVTTTERARDLAHSPVSVLGVGVGHGLSDGSYSTNQRYTELPVATAKESAFTQADRSLDDVDIAHLYDGFSCDVISQVEDYGWCARGEGAAFIKETGIGPSGNLPVNTSGGLLSAYNFSDLTGISESIVQLRKMAGDRQVEDASLCLVSGNGGEMMAGGLCPTHSSLLLGTM